jgi:hypothetical protein
MTNRLVESDMRFLAAFEACQFSAGEFRHRDHVRLAYIYLALYPFETALEKTEQGLRKLLAHLGAPSSKYHHTVTHAWLLAVQHAMEDAGPTAGFAQFLNAGGVKLLNPAMMRQHYSSAVLTSDDARQRFVAPDLQPFPQHAR